MRTSILIPLSRLRALAVVAVLGVAPGSVALAGPATPAASAAPAPGAPTAGAPGRAGGHVDPHPGDPARDLDATDPALGADVIGRRPVHGPGIGAVLAAAYAAAGLDHDPQDSWIRRARLTGLVPWVTVRTTRDTSWQDEHSEVGHGSTLELRATWRLDRLLFDAKELQVAAVESARRRERRRLAARVIRAYFTWRRAASLVSDDDRVTTRVAEAAAELDALTDGWFSEQLARSSHSAAPGPATR